MSQFLFPAFLGLAIWWGSTCLIMFLDGLPRRTFTWSMAGASVALVVALDQLRVSAADASSAGAYLGFTCGVVIWAWLEMSFYMGYVTGPRTRRCAHGCAGWRHFGHAVMACLYHEIAILALAATVMILTWGQPNQFGAWSFVVLWWMHQSARLNVFLGVSNLNPEFLPDHLDHIKGFLTRKPMNLLFPFSVTASTICAVRMAMQASADPADTFGTTGYALLATMMILAILEHWFLVMPLPAARLWNGLWRWSLVSRTEANPQPNTHNVTLPAQATIGGRP